MGEAWVFDALGQVDGSVRLGPLVLRPALTPPSGALKLAVRPQAWRVRPQGEPHALPATLIKAAYLGSFFELSFDTDLGAILVVSPDVRIDFAPGQRHALTLAESGFSVVGATS